MKNILKISLLSMAVFLFAAGMALGAGFKLPEQGAKAMGMSMAWTAQADDPSAIYYNPAGITQVEGIHILLGGTLIDARGSTFKGLVKAPPTLGLPPGTVFPTNESGRNQEFFAPVAYYTVQATEKLFLGIGINAPFGLSRTYSSDFTVPPTQKGNVGLDVQHVSLQTVVVNPTVAYKFNEYISIGAGVDFMYGEAELDRTLGPGLEFHLDGDGDAWSWNAGVLVTPGYNLKFGVSYRNGYNLEIDGDAKAFGLSTGGKTKVKMGDILVAAVAYQTEKLTIEFDYDYTFWSAFENLDIRLDSSLGPIPAFNPQAKNWGDVAAYRLGLRYDFSSSCYGSAGIFYDETPIPENTLGSELPDSDRRGFSLGAGFRVKNIGVDLSYIYFDYRDRRVNNAKYDGTWENLARLYALNLSYAF
jgi:long-chain fatty acid transport protein